MTKEEAEMLAEAMMRAGVPIAWATQAEDSTWTVGATG